MNIKKIEKEIEKMFENIVCKPFKEKLKEIEHRLIKRPKNKTINFVINILFCLQKIIGGFFDLS